MSNLVNNGDVQVQALINAANQRASDSQDDNSTSDAEMAALNKKIELQVQLKQAALKSGISEHETFSSEQNVNFNKALRGGMGADAQRWAANPDLQNKLTVAQKRLFLASFGDSAAQASTVAGAMNRLAEVQNFTQAVPTTQAMGDLHAAVQNNPKIEEPAKQLLQTSFMQAPKANTATKADFMRFGLQQMNKGGDMRAVKAAGDMLGVLATNVPGRAQSRAMGMVRRDPTNTEGMKNVDSFVQGPPVQKLPLAARGTATEALVKANGASDVADGLNKVAEALTSGQVPPDAEGMPPKPAPAAKKMSREMKARLFATIATGRPSELRGITDKTLLALQSNNFPTRQSQVKSFMTALQSKVASGDGSAKDIDPDALVRRSKAGPLPKIPTLKSTEGLDDDDARIVRAQNRAVVMKYYNQVNRSYAGVNDKLQGGEYLEDVRTLPNLRESDKFDTSHLSDEDKADIDPLLKLKGGQAQSTFGKLKVSQQKRMRELRGKRMPKAERMKKAAERRSVGVQPKYFNVSSLRGARKAPSLPVPSQSAGAGGNVRSAPPLGGRAQDTQQRNAPQLPVPQRGLSEAQNGRGMASAPGPQRNMGGQGAMSSQGGGRAMAMQSSMGGNDPSQAMASRIANSVDKSAPMEVQMHQMTQAMASVMQEQMASMQAQFSQAMSAMMSQHAPPMPDPSQMPQQNMKAPVSGRPMSPQAPELPMNEPHEQERSMPMMGQSAPQQQRRNVGGEAEFLRAPPPMQQQEARAPQGGPKSLGAVEGVGDQRSQGFGAAVEAAGQQLQGQGGQHEAQARGPQQPGIAQQHDPRAQAQNPSQQQGFTGQPQQPGIPQNPLGQQHQFTQQQQQVVQQNGQVPGITQAAPQNGARPGMSVSALAQAAAQGNLPPPTMQAGFGGQPQTSQHPNAVQQPGVERTNAGQREQEVAANGMGGNAPVNSTGNVNGPQQLSAVEAVGARPKGKAAEEMKRYSAAVDQSQRDGQGIPNAMLCPISLQPMERPVKASDGQVYDQSSIEQWMAQSPNPTSPLTREPLTAKLEAQPELQKQIQSFLGNDDTVQSKLSQPQKNAVQKAVEQGVPRGQAVLRMLNSSQPNAPVENLLQEIKAPLPQSPKINIDPNAPRQPAEAMPGKPGFGQPPVGNNPQFGDARAVNPQFGNVQAPNPQFGNAQAPNPQFGNVQAPNPQFGNAQAPNPQFGNAQGPNPQFGNVQAQAPNPQFGNDQGVNPQFGRTQAANPQFNNGQGVNPPSNNGQRASSQFANNQVANPQPGHAQATNPQFDNGQGVTPQGTHPQFANARAAHPHSNSTQAVNPQFGNPQFASTPSNNGQFGNVQQPGNDQQYGNAQDNQGPFAQAGRTQGANPNAAFQGQGVPQQPTQNQPNQPAQSLDAIQGVGARQPGGRSAVDQVTKYRQSTETTSPNYQQPTSFAAPQQQGPVQGKVDGWGIQRSFERDLGATANRQPVRPAAQRREETNPFVTAGDPSYAQLEQKEEYTGRMVVKPSTQMRDMATVYDLSWRQLSNAEQAPLKNLGWSQQVWDTKASTNTVPAAYFTPFAKLRGPQKQSVRSMGFSAEEWDESVSRYQAARDDDNGSSDGGGRRGGQGRGGQGGRQR